MYCNKCGKEIKDNANFCNYCGNNVKAISNLENGTKYSNANLDKYVVNANVMLDVIASILLLVMGIIYSSDNIIIGVAPFCCGIFYLIRRLAFPNSLIIDKNGITDNFSYIPKGFMPWSNIQDVNIVPSTLGKLMQIKINDNSPSYYKSIEIKLNNNTSKTISLPYTGVTPETVLYEISKYRPK